MSSLAEVTKQSAHTNDAIEYMETNNMVKAWKYFENLKQNDEVTSFEHRHSGKGSHNLDEGPSEKSWPIV